jgi:integrase
VGEEIKVHVVKYPDRANLVMRYLCPLTGKQVQRSTGIKIKREAERVAAKWEAELREGRYQKSSRMTWEAFRDYYAANALPAVADSTATTYEATLNVFERITTPQRLADVTTARITGFVTELRNRKLAEATIARHLRGLKAALRWAHREGLLIVLPTIKMPKRIKGAKIMRGRPITGEEFDRILAAVPKVVENTAAASWKFYLCGLWASGLRLTESLTLRWDDAPGAIVVDLGGRRPMLRIPAEAEKGHTDRLLPITPEFATLLQSIAEHERRGRVFKLLANDGRALPLERTIVGKTVTAIGEAAGVVVDERQRAGKTVRKFASAHDLRRAFGQRWAAKVMPTVLRELMRHASINTTMAYYVGTNAEATADVLWSAVGTSLGTTDNSTENGRYGERSKGTAKQGKS